MNDSTWNSTSPEVNFSSNITAQASFSMGGLQMVLSVNLLIGLPTHSYVIWLIARGRNGITSEFYNFNLNVCEIFFSLSSLSYMQFKTLPISLTIQTLSFGLVITGRPLFQCLMCIERYVAVVHPVTFLKHKPFRYKCACSVFAWLLCVGSCLFSFFIFLSNIYAFIWFILVQFLFFLSIQLFCCIAVLRALKQSGPGERKKEKEDENRIKRRAFHLILITAITMAIIYVPFIIAIMLCFLIQLDHLVVMPISFGAFILGGFVQSVLYLHRTGKLSCC